MSLDILYYGQPYETADYSNNTGTLDYLYYGQPYMVTATSEEQIEDINNIIMII